MSIYTDLLNLAATALHRPVAELSLDAPFEEQNLNSIDMVEILLAVEDRFGIYVPDSVVVELRNLGQLAAWLDEHVTR